MTAPTTSAPDLKPSGQGTTRLPADVAIRLVAEREIRTRVLSKPFLGGLAVSVALVLLGFVLATALGNDDPTRLGLVGDEPPSAVATLEALADLEDRDVEIERFNDVDAAETAITNGDIDAAIVDGTTFVVKRNDPELLGFVSAAWQQAGLVDGLGDVGLGPDQIDQALASGQPLTTRELEPDDDREANEAVAFVSVIILFISVQVGGAYILMGVLEEKTSKVVELMLSSISARDLLTGKVVGIGVIGLIQVLVLIASFLIGAAIVGPDSLPPITVGMVVGGIVWFLVGYLLYGSLFAAGASLVSRQEDAQSALAPISVVIMASYFASLYIAGDPDATAARVLSLLPPIAPFAMPGRMAIGNVSTWELLVSFGVATMSVAVVLALAGKIYVRSVLHTDRAIGWREAWRMES